MTATIYQFIPRKRPAIAQRGIVVSFGRRPSLTERIANDYNPFPTGSKSRKRELLVGNAV